MKVMTDEEYMQLIAYKKKVVEMKKPETYRELLELVSPQDLEDVLNFSGRNDKLGTKHWDLKREYSDLIWNSIKDYRRKEPRYRGYKLTEDFYDTIIKCIQDYYRWTRGFVHSQAHIFKRVMNALQIPIEMIKN